LTASIRRALGLAVLVLGCASAAGAAPPPEDSARAVPDSLGHSLRAPGALARLLAHQDSVIKAQGGPRADNAQLYLSWSAPWGSKRAQQARRPACADSTKEDTLFLSFLPGRAGNTFTGFTTQLLFHATASDTLGPWWHL